MALATSLVPNGRTSAVTTSPSPGLPPIDTDDRLELARLRIARFFESGDLAITPMTGSPDDPMP